VQSCVEEQLLYIQRIYQQTTCDCHHGRNVNVKGQASELSNKAFLTTVSATQ